MSADKKGMGFSSIKSAVLALVLLGAVIYLILPILGGGENSATAKALEAERDFMNKVLGETSEYCNDLGKEQVENIIDDELSDVNDGEKFRNFFKAIAWQESNFQHCTDGKITQNEQSYGLMQITEATAGDVCPELNVLGMRDNIRCGKKVIYSKMNIAEDDATYTEGVDKNCDNSEYKTTYLGYSDIWDRTARAYNGLGCGAGADLNYVEDINNIIKERSWNS